MPENEGSFWRQNLGNIVVGLIGAVGAIAAAVIPIVWNRSEPAPAAITARDNGAAAPPATAAAAKEQDNRPQVVRDLEQIQGEWEGISREVPEEIKAKMAARNRGQRSSPLEAPPKVTWEIRGNQLTIRVMLADGGEGPTIRGTFGLREDRSAQARLFDFHGKSSAGAELNWSGVYQLEGESLQICYRDQDRRLDDGKDPGRAVAFNSDWNRGGGIFVKFKKRASG
jgi:uncharacterized protein (TIGR03067 family)